MVAPTLLHHGISDGGAIDSRGHNCRGRNGILLPSALCRGSSLVVEVVLELCIHWVVPLHVLTLVLGNQNALGWGSPGSCLFVIHVYDIDGSRISMWHCRIPVLLLVYKEDLWGCKGRLVDELQEHGASRTNCFSEMCTLTLSVMNPYHTRYN